MRAARINAFGERPILEEQPLPNAATGESVIRIEAAVVGHLDLGVAAGRFPLLPAVPYTPGTGGAGRVLESETLPAGALVEVRGGGIGLVRDGTWAERVAVPDEALHLHPETADPLVAATFYSSFSTAHVALFEVGQLGPGERVAVTGAAGAVGALAVHLALRAGAGEVIGIVSSEERRNGVPTGATTAAGLDEALSALDPPADLIVDTVGGDYLRRLIERVRPGGRISLVGYTRGERVTLDLPSLLFADVKLLPVNVMSWRGIAGETLDLAARDEVLRGGFPASVETFPLERVQDAVERLASGRASGRVVLVPDN